METVEHIFVAFGGSGKVALALGVKPSAASEMRRRKSIPVKYWPRLIAACRVRKIRGVTAESLVSIHAEAEAA